MFMKHKYFSLKSLYDDKSFVSLKYVTEHLEIFQIRNTDFLLSMDKGSYRKWKGS